MSLQAGWLLVGAAVLLAAHAGAQQAFVHLAADPEQRGPDGWTVAREQWLPERCDDHRRDPSAELALVVDEQGVHFDATSSPPLNGAYLTAVLHAPGCGDVTVRCEWDGAETWTADGTAAPWGRLRDLLEVCGAWGAFDPIELDVPALAGGLAAATVSNDAEAMVRQLVAAHCGELTLRTQIVGDRCEVVARSAGGLLLPALLCLAADVEGRPDPRLARFTATDRWLLLARAGRGSLREEAVRQLTRCDDPAATAALLALLHADDHVRAVAMAALLRRGDPETLPSLLAAASPSIALTEPLAAAAVARLLPEAAPATRARVQAALAEHRSVRLRALAAQAPALAAGVPLAMPHPGAPPPPALPLPVVLGCLALVLATALAAGRLTSPRS